MYVGFETKGYVYIMASRTAGTLYTGVTSDLMLRVSQHIDGTFGGFTEKYHVKRLVYYEEHGSMETAIRREKALKKWQREWVQTTKRRTTKEYFPYVAERLKMKLQLTQNFTTIVTGHGKTREYLQRFKIIEKSTCPCGKGDQTTDHIIYVYTCEMLTETD